MSIQSNSSNIDQGGHRVRHRWLRYGLRAMSAAAVLSSCSAVRRAEAFTGTDTKVRPQICLVVAPHLLPPDELQQVLKSVLDHVAAAHGSVVGYVAAGPSAAAFPSLSFSAEANGGILASKAGNDGARNHDATGWAAKVLAELKTKVSLTMGTGQRPDGLDLFGGIAQCALKLSNATRQPTIIVISHGIHRTSDLDLVERTNEVGSLIAAKISELVPSPLSLRLYELGRIDADAIGGPPARSVVEPVVAGWVAACEQLADRCTIGKEP